MLDVHLENMLGLILSQLIKKKPWASMLPPQADEKLFEAGTNDK